MRIRATRTLAASVAAIVGIAAIATSPASAGSSPQTAIHAAKAGTTDVSARRRHYHRGNAAVIGAVTGLFGTIASIAAANAWRDAHRQRYYEPQYYEPAPYAYAPYPYYGPRW